MLGAGRRLRSVKSEGATARHTTVYCLPQAAGWRPEIQTGGPRFGVQTNRFGFNVMGNSGLGLEVETSTDLGNPTWSSLGTCTLAGGPFYFSDPQWTNYPARSYRLHGTTFGGRPVMLWNPLEEINR